MKTKKVFMAAALVLSTVLVTGCKKGETITFDKYSQYKEINTIDCVTIGDYKGLEISEDTFDVSDADIDSKVSSVLYENGYYVDAPDKELGNGDKVNISMTGYIDGKKNDGFTSENYEFVYGDGEYVMDGFTANLAGIYAGEVASFELEIPSTFGESQLIGKTVTFQVTCNSIQKYFIPEFTDAFVQEISDCSTINEYRDSLIPVIKKDKLDRVNADKVNGVWQIVVDRSEVITYPQEVTDAMKEKLNDVLGMYAKMYGMEVDAYVSKYYGMTFDEYVQVAVKQELLLDAVGRKENISLSDKQYEEALSTYASKYGYNDVNVMVEKVGEDKIKQAMLWDKVKSFVADQVSIKTK